MKKTLLFTVLVICTHFTFAQDDDDKTFKFGLGGTFSIPVGDLKQSFSYGVGFEATAVYNVTENISGFAQAGIGVFRSTDAFAGDENNVLHIPLIVGARFKFDGFFAGGGVGYGKWNNQSSGTSGFLYSPQAGYDFGDYQVMLHYTTTTVTGGSLSYAGFKFFRTF